MADQSDIDWIPDWYYTNRRERPSPETIPLNELDAVHFSHRIPTTPNHDANSGTDEDGFKRGQKIVIVTPSKDRTVNRKLGGLQLAMITVNATLGTGLYWRGGQVLQIGGPLAVPLAYLVPGFLAWAVMQCITEMLCIWPIPGALAVYVSEFVDVELGIAVGIAYWFTYSVSFAALIATAAAEIHFWSSEINFGSSENGFDGGVVYFLIPLILVILNSLPVSLYGWLEVITSTLKLMFLLVIIGFLIAINVWVGTTYSKPSIGFQYWEKPTEFDESFAHNWVTSLFICISLTAFAYVGVEIVAASALEARWPSRNAHTPTDLSQRSEKDLLIGKTVKFSAAHMPILFTLAYVVSGVLASFNISRRDEHLPQLSSSNTTSVTASNYQSSTSIFVIIAQESEIPHLADIFNAFLVFTALSCANTNLYVASRSLFGLASRLDGGSGQSRMLRILAWFGRTNGHKVPVRAVVLSAMAFWWISFLQLRSDQAVDAFIDVLGNMGSVGVIIVWACECWAFIRFYHCIYRHRTALQTQRIAQVRRWDAEDWDDYPYRSHLQPFLAYVSLAGCLFILVVVDGSTLWNGFHPTLFLSPYLVIIVFLGLWAFLKVVRRANWSLVDLDNEAKVINKIRELHDFRLGAS